MSVEDHGHKFVSNSAFEMAILSARLLFTSSTSSILRRSSAISSVSRKNPISSNMVVPSSIFSLYALFAVGPSNPNSNNSPGGARRGRSSNSANKPIGRSRYAGGGGGRGGGRGGGGRGGGRGRGKRKRPSNNSGQQKRSPSSINVPLPPLTSPNSARPSYFTCRHTYEDTLTEEVLRQIATYTLGGKDATDNLSVLSPHPGLICLQYNDADVTELLPECYNPTYALQSIPNCVIVKAKSIKGLAIAIMDALLDESDERTASIQSQLWSAPRGSLSVHALVPDMFHGVPDPPMKRRSYKVAEEVAAQLKKICPVARPSRADDVDGKGEGKKEKWVLQILLLEPEVVAASLAKCNTIRGAVGNVLPCSLTWPNWSLPAGLAKVDIEQVMPSSAYRKLLEALWFMEDRPPAASTNADVLPVVDLGACPGGWSGALRLLGCSTLSVDRSPLAESLMQDPMVNFVKGDAFTFAPPWVDTETRVLDSPPDDSWMVSDIIAYPERVSELLEDWCGKRWVSRVVVTVKFQGKEIPWDELKNAEEVARGNGYACLTKHFFNNKNEVTLMAVNEKCKRNFALVGEPLLGEPMYPAVLTGKKADKKK